MFRTFFRMAAVGGVVAVGTLLTAPAAHAEPEPICQFVVLDGTLTGPEPQIFGGCIPYGDDVSCDTTHTGAPAIEEAYITICFPSLGITPSS